MSDTIEFSLTWGDNGSRIEGKLPAIMAARVIHAAMQPETVVIWEPQDGAA